MKILKTFWKKRHDGEWYGSAIQGLDLRGKLSADLKFFPIQDGLVLTQAPSVGTIRSVMGESIVPIVAAADNENVLRCLGTGFFISCSGLLITAAHVIIDPIERKYAKASEIDDVTWFTQKLNLGVLIPLNPLMQGGGYLFYPFEWSMLLAERRESPLPFAGVDLKLTTDIAICKVASRPDGSAHPPLSIIQPGIVGTGMVVGSTASAIGYSGMADIEVTAQRHGVAMGDHRFDLHVSTGPVLEHFPDNLTQKTVSTPGPCFAFAAKIPPGMSGSPILDREGIYVHGVVSKGLEDESGIVEHAYGSMLGPSMGLPIGRLGGATLIELQRAGKDGIPILQGPGL